MAYSTIDERRATLNETLPQFIQNHGDGHITQASFDFWKNHVLKDADKVIVLYLSEGTTNSVAISLAALVGNEVKHSITVVHRDYRRRGIGKLLLTQKIAIARARGWPFTTTIAADNIASGAMCDSTGLLRCANVTVHKRERGEYNALTLTVAPGFDTIPTQP